MSNRLTKDCYLCGKELAVVSCDVCNLPVCADCYINICDNIYCKADNCIIEAIQYLKNFLLEE